MFSQPPPRQKSLAKAREEGKDQKSAAKGKEEEKVVKVQKSRVDSIDGETRRYEFGRLVSGGMIGSTYMARLKFSNGLQRFFCIKRMRGKPLAEKSLFGSVKRELEIL
jgi:hypothetical protein